MTKPPANSKIPALGKRKKPQNKVAKRGPANRLGLVITPGSITLVEKTTGSLRYESVPITEPMITSAGLTEAANLTAAVKVLKAKLGSKLRHVDVHYPGALTQLQMLDVPNISPENPDEIKLAGQLRFRDLLNINETETNTASFHVAGQSALAVIATDRRHLSALVDAVSAGGLTVTAMVPTVFTALAGIKTPDSTTAVVYLEPDGNALLLMKGQRLLYVESLLGVSRAVKRAASSGYDTEAFASLEQDPNFNPTLIGEAIKEAVTQANDHLISLKLDTIDQVLVVGSLSVATPLQHYLTGTLGMHIGEGRLSEFADRPLLVGAISPVPTDPADPRGLNLLTPDLRPVSSRSTPNIGLLIPIALTAAWGGYAGVVALQASSLGQEQRTKEGTLVELQRFASEQQKLQRENTSIMTTLSLRQQIEATNIPWPDIIARFANAIPTTDTGYLATISSFTARETKPDSTKFGNLPAAYAYDITANAGSRNHILDFIRNFSAAPYAIDVQRIEKTKEGAWTMTATVGTIK